MIQLLLFSECSANAGPPGKSCRERSRVTAFFIRCDKCAPSGTGATRRALSTVLQVTTHFPRVRFSLTCARRRVHVLNTIKHTGHTRHDPIFARPSAQRRVGILCGWSNGRRVLFSIVPGDPSRPETWRRRILEDTFSALWCSTAWFVRLIGPSVRCPKMMFFKGFAPKRQNSEDK